MFLKSCKEKGGMCSYARMKPLSLSLRKSSLTTRFCIDCNRVYVQNRSGFWSELNTEGNESIFCLPHLQTITLQPKLLR